MIKPKPPQPELRPYDYKHRWRPVGTASVIAAEYAELRTRTPGGKG